MPTIGPPKELKKRGRKPKNKAVEVVNTLEEQIDSDKEVIIAYLPINLSDINTEKKEIEKQPDDDIFIKSENIKSCYSDEKYTSQNANNCVKSNYGKFFNKINIYNIKFNSNTKCWWCKNCFESEQLALPEQYFNETFYCLGNFCSYNCIKAYNIDINDHLIWKRESLINLMYYFTYGIFKEITPAPSWLILEDFGGIINIIDFRQNFDMLDLEYIVLQPPIISRQMQIEESYKKNQPQNFIINKSNNSENFLTLKRSKPIETSQLNLEISMGLKILD